MVEHANIQLFTNNKNWSEPQRKMMRKSGRFHGLRTAVGLYFLVMSVTAGLWVRGRVLENQNQDRAAGLVAAVMRADIANVPGFINEINDFRQWTDGPRLRGNLPSI